jgi:hypothetical protein
MAACEQRSVPNRHFEALTVKQFPSFSLSSS